MSTSNQQAPAIAPPAQGALWVKIIARLEQLSSSLGILIPRDTPEDQKLDGVLTRYFAELSDEKWERHKKNAANLSSDQKRALVNNCNNPSFEEEQLSLLFMCASEHPHNQNVEEVEAEKDWEIATKNVCQDHYVSMILKDKAVKVGKTLDSKELPVYFQLLEHSREVAENTSRQEVADRSKLVGLAADMGITPR